MLTPRDDGMFYANAAGRRNILCLRRGTHVLALKHAAPRLRGLRLGLQTRAGHGPDGAHANHVRAQPLKNSAGRVPQAAD